VKAGQAIRKLGGKVENRAEGETDQAYLDSLTDQYKKLRASMVVD
jgi:hypothetical protein